MFAKLKGYIRRFSTPKKETNYEPNPDDGRLVVSKRYYDLYFHQPDIIQVVFKKL